MKHAVARSARVLRSSFDEAFGRDYARTRSGTRLLIHAWRILGTGEPVVMAVVEGHRFVGNYLPRHLPNRIRSERTIVPLRCHPPSLVNRS